MLLVKFKYRDGYTHGEWREQECTCESISECKEWYGLGTDCEYEIISVENK